MHLCTHTYGYVWAVAYVHSAALRVISWIHWPTLEAFNFWGPCGAMLSRV